MITHFLNNGTSQGARHLAILKKVAYTITCGSGVQTYSVKLNSNNPTTDTIGDGDELTHTNSSVSPGGNGFLNTIDTAFWHYEGYEFDGWTVDGKNFVDVSSYELTKDTTFVAVYTQIHTVSFLYEEEIISTQTIRNGEYASFVNAENTTYKQFNGWTINGSIVDVANYKISSSVVFTASITYKYDVNFMVNDELYNSQIVTQNNYVVVPNIPEIKDYIFGGWSVNGEQVDLTNYRITENTTFVAIMTYAPAGLFNDDGSLLMSWDDMIANNYIALTDTEGVITRGTNEERLTVAGHLKISDTVTGFEPVYSTSYGAFSGWSGIKSIEIPSSITSFANYTFYNMSSLETIKIQEGLKFNSSVFGVILMQF
jgi:hypothetical protein